MGFDDLASRLGRRDRRAVLLPVLPAEGGELRIEAGLCEVGVEVRAVAMIDDGDMGSHGDDPLLVIGLERETWKRG